ncbi:mercury resistance system transport protein MerF [Oceanisphaera sp.]|uniref:mercury resistance system transport protein MerF n=1 Tax=Oceanisphaera sp. TaxID=1929979 RepID=UPI003A8D5CC5
MKNASRLIKVGAIGSAIAALCCFTPVLVWLFAVLGISAWVGYLDYLLFPALALCLVMLVIGLVQRWRDKSP